MDLLRYLVTQRVLELFELLQCAHWLMHLQPLNPSRWQKMRWTKVATMTAIFEKFIFILYP